MRMTGACAPCEKSSVRREILHCLARSHRERDPRSCARPSTVYVRASSAAKRCASTARGAGRCARVSARENLRPWRHRVARRCAGLVDWASTPCVPRERIRIRGKTRPRVTVARGRVLALQGRVAGAGIPLGVAGGGASAACGCRQKRRRISAPGCRRDPLRRQCGLAGSPQKILLGGV